VVYNGRSKNGASGLAAERSAAVFTCGRLWDEAKNAAVLDAAAGRTRAPIWAAGAVKNPRGEEIRLPNLRLLGELGSDAVRQRLDGSGVYLSAALYEPFGLGVLEAAQCGCALVLSDIATFRELWSGAALLVDPRDPQGYAEAVETLRKSPVQRAEWGRRAQRRAGAFTSARMATGTLSVYAQASRQPGFAREAS
jgi:glycogen synthase